MSLALTGDIFRPALGCPAFAAGFAKVGGQLRKISNVRSRNILLTSKYEAK